MKLKRLIDCQNIDHLIDFQLTVAALKKTQVVINYNCPSAFLLICFVFVCLFYIIKPYLLSSCLKLILNLENSFCLLKLGTNSASCVMFFSPAGFQEFHKSCRRRMVSSTDLKSMRALSTEKKLERKKNWGGGG